MRRQMVAKVPHVQGNWLESMELLIEVVEWSSTSQSPTDSCRTVRIPAGLHYNLDDFELGEKISLKSSGILRTT